MISDFAEEEVGVIQPFVYRHTNVLAKCLSLNLLPSSLPRSCLLHSHHKAFTTLPSLPQTHSCPKQDSRSGNRGPLSFDPNLSSRLSSFLLLQTNSSLQPNCSASSDQNTPFGTSSKKKTRIFMLGNYRTVITSMW